MRAKPLDGIKVLDLSRLLPGALCTQHLADMGADVLKIEDPGLGDYSRWIKPLMKTHSGFFLTVSRNKRAMKLDLKKPEGKEVFAKLADDADVIFESFRPGVVDRLGIGYDDIRAINPRIVYCSLSGYGQDGPYRERAGHDVNYCSYAGVTDQTGDWESPPALLNFQIADLAGGSLSSVMGILAALVDQQRTGKGRYVDVSMTDCTLAHAVIPLARMGIEGAPRARGDDYLTGGIPSYGIYETADHRYVSLGALEPKFWNSFCAAINRDDLVDRGETWGDDGRVVRAELMEIFMSQTQTYWIDFSERVDCCLAPVLSLKESMDNEQIQARGMFVTDQHPTDGEVLQFAFPIKFSEFEFSIDRSAPLHGEHTEQVLRLLGYDDGAITQMRDSEVI